MSESGENLRLSKCVGCVGLMSWLLGGNLSCDLVKPSSGVSGSLSFTRPLPLHSHMVYLDKQKAFLSLGRPFFSAQLALLAPCVGMFAATGFFSVTDRTSTRTIVVTWRWSGRKELRLNKPKENPLTEQTRKGKRETEGDRGGGRRKR